jgi:hypothetical protein
MRLDSGSRVELGCGLRVGQGVRSPRGLRKKIGQLKSTAVYNHEIQVQIAAVRAGPLCVRFRGLKTAEGRRRLEATATEDVGHG